MIRKISLLRALAAIGLFVGLAFFPAKGFAVVSDVTLTGLPPQTTISLTNDATGETEQGKSDDRGVVVIPLGGRTWQPGNYTVTGKSSMSPETPSRKIQLSDGSNTVNLNNLFTYASGLLMPGLSHSIDVHTGVRFFDGALKPIDPSFSLRIDYSPPLRCCENSFSVFPYGSFWTIPSVNIGKHRPYDFNGIFQAKVDSGSLYGLNLGLKHVSDLSKWGFGPFDPPSSSGPKYVRMLGVLMAGVGWVRYDFTMKRLATPLPVFVNVHHFTSKDNAFRFDLNAGVSASWENGLFLGARGGAGPTRVHIFNGGKTWRTEGNVGLTGGFRW